MEAASIRDFGQAVSRDVTRVALPESREETIPEGKDGAKVSVLIRLVARMVATVEIGRDQDGAKRAVHPGGNSQIRVGEAVLDYKGEIRGQYGGSRDTEQRDGCERSSVGEESFDGMKANSSGDFEIGL